MYWIFNINMLSFKNYLRAKVEFLTQFAIYIYEFFTTLKYSSSNYDDDKQKLFSSVSL
jgi:hypothetical protein